MGSGAERRARQLGLAPRLGTPDGNGNGVGVVCGEEPFGERAEDMKLGV